MTMKFTRRLFCTAVASTMLLGPMASSSFAADKLKLRLASSSSATENRATALTEVFAPAIAGFATFEPHWNSSLFKQGTELEAIARGNLEMALASTQELAVFFPEFSIFTAGYVHRDAAHQVAVFNDPLMDPFKEKVKEELNLKLLSVVYLGRRQVNLRTDQHIESPEDLNGVNLRMPGTEAWQFLGKALGANPTPMAFSEVYTGLQTGAVDGQDNPLPTVVDKKFYEVTKQIVLTSHLVDLNYLTISNSIWEDLTSEQQDQLQAAANRAAAYGSELQMTQEDELIYFLKEKGLKVYEPNVAAFRDRVQGMYQESDFAKDWPNGLIDKINAL